MRRLVPTLLVMCLVMFISAAHAWNKPGHMTSAAIAYADLKERNPVVLAKVVEVLKQHPQFKSNWAPKLDQVSAPDRDLYLFMVVGRWSDDTRKKYPEYDRPAWHYVNFPFRPGEAPGAIPEVESIISSFPDNRTIAQSASADNTARAVALCWMFHLTGDIHQPLHTAKLVTDQFPEPEGDSGGTGFYIRVKPDKKTISLHQLWDGLILGSDKFKAVSDERQRDCGAGLDSSAKTSLSSLP
jgi:hypothetical protein